ncbi:MAG: hypothetical protein WC997_13985 [Porticoccaceae bacterium]
MDTAEKMEIVEKILSRAADQLGDVTTPSMENYYRRFPDAGAAFENHSRHGDRAQLEGLMIENSLYCLMYWFESPSEIKIMLEDSVPHHDETLHVTPEWYKELIDATAEVIATTIPRENNQELAVWNELRNDLRTLIDSAAK